ncbi:LemA protein [Abditibacterium utsteinense]|uniref:LemA protein n=1 Tax=Abditibacterium utsteinense TaxID=1960156 RepID=A0A2S8SW68_9BACT|nr:LemA family protein [Abditibacterium utsteinense]PQV65040.1 LemA protein [Abditibacterium utsteinense]
MNISYFLLGAFIFAAIWLLCIYNGFVSRRNAVENAFASLDANLQKRFDLIPNLVATVKGYAAHEKETLESLSQLRAKSQTPEARAQNDGASAQLVGAVFAVAESYPELKSSNNFLHLGRSLNEIEEQISASRRAFNAAVNIYNTSLETFPGNLFASAFGFSRRDFFATDEASRAAPNLAGKL